MSYLLSESFRQLAVGVVCLSTAIASWHASAGVVIEGSRQIYPELRREITVRLTNDDRQQSRLVQVWLSGAEQDADAADAPFNITPPVFRLDAGKSQALRVTYTKEPLPVDKESVFWLNVLEVPPKVDIKNQESDEGSNQLTFAFRIRTKLFFRPNSLPGNSEQAPAQLRWTLRPGNKNGTLEVFNPSAFHVTFNEVALTAPDGTQVPLALIASDAMVAPGQVMRFAQANIPSSFPQQMHVEFKYINDYGGFSLPQRAPLHR